MDRIVDLFFSFFKIGLFAVGGGPATIPYLMDLTETRDWFTMQELTNMIAISESTPGPVGLNMATYAGVTTVGVWGGLIASLGLVVPSVIVIIIIAKFLQNFSENRYVKAAFTGVRPAVTALIAMAVYNLCKVSLFVETESGLQPAIKTMVLAVIVFGLMRIKKLSKLHPAMWLFGAAVIGIIFRF
ncbi:MAG: chromate transporter [Lachnospiraceae bacterium]|nr:chromate transporter [Lachnospiraceae bacterium]MBQ9927990.1 chromate transporter [Lachnospiraceae bacterium]